MSAEPLLEEGVLPTNSLHNARQLIQRHGKPGQLYFHGDRRKGDYDVTAWWELSDGTLVKHVFAGFGWGYGGLGPRGFEEFLMLCGKGEDEARLVARFVAPVLEAHMDEDKQECTSASLSLSEEFHAKHGFIPRHAVAQRAQ